MKKLILLRKFSQLTFLGIFIYILWSTTYPLKGIISPSVLFKLDPLIMVFTAISERVLLSGLIFSLIMIALTIILGRFFCGWVCPMGTIIDGLGALRIKKKKPLGDKQNKKIRGVKFYIFAIIVFFSLIGIQVAWVFDPIVIVARFVSFNLIPTVTLCVDTLFIGLIKRYELYGPVYDFYQLMKSSFLGINVYYFENSVVILNFFLLITLVSFFVTRLWCRVLCPLGALYAIFAKSSFLRRVNTECSNCSVCRSHCRMGAIKTDFSYIKGECILCMDCIYDCKEGKVNFGFSRKEGNDQERKNNTRGITRRDFLFLTATSWLLFGSRSLSKASADILKTRGVLRPPGVSDEDKFLNTCVRCGNCMKVCVTNGLQPVMLESGYQGIWTPQLVPEIGYCEYNCTLCGEVCPTGAIPELVIHKKRKFKIGIAEINENICIPYAGTEQCIVCEEHCPTPDKAIKTEEVIINGKRILRPRVDKKLCIGCGICQNKCPVSPVRAIIVKPI